MWSGLSVRTSRFVSLALFFSFALVLGMKPGMLSWHLPFAFLAFGSVPLAARRLQSMQIMEAIGWSIIAVASSAVYPWYLLFVLVWLGVSWFSVLGRKGFGRVAAWWTLAAVGVSLISAYGAVWVTQTAAGAMRLEYYDRLAFVVSRMPFVSGTVLLTGLWIALFIPVMRRSVGTAEANASLALQAWMSLLLCFLSSPFTGAFIQNDHFRAPTVIVSWLSMALVWNLTRSAEVRPSPPSYLTRGLMVALLLVSGLYTIQILAQPYAWNHDLLNVLHLTHWFAFVLTAMVEPINPAPPVTR
jgi:hypothetical protein